jgi:hypothetical protein
MGYSEFFEAEVYRLTASTSEAHAAGHFYRMVVIWLKYWADL